MAHIVKLISFNRFNSCYSMLDTDTSSNVQSVYFVWSVFHICVLVHINLRIDRKNLWFLFYGRIEPEFKLEVITFIVALVHELFISIFVTFFGGCSLSDTKDCLCPRQSEK
jgi:hypothetical protein